MDHVVEPILTRINLGGPWTVSFLYIASLLCAHSLLHTKKSEVKTPAVSRVPVELWYMVLEEVIDPSIDVSLTYEGSCWSADAPVLLADDQFGIYGASEKQRKIIGSVCRSWRAFSQSKKSKTTKSSQVPASASEGPEFVARMRRFIYEDKWGKLLQSKSIQSVDWEMLVVKQWDVEAFGNLAHHQVQRLQAHGIYAEEYIATGLLCTLGFFTNLTWLSIYHSPRQAYSVRHIRGSNGSPLVLPNLQVFLYRTPKFHFPTSLIRFPSLQYLGIRIDSRLDDSDLKVIMAQCMKSIKSVAIVQTGVRIPPAICPPEWNKFPNLKELVVEHWFHTICYSDQPVSIHPRTTYNLLRGDLRWRVVSKGHQEETLDLLSF